jgi:hypothetical protein
VVAHPLRSDLGFQLEATQPRCQPLGPAEVVDEPGDVAALEEERRAVQPGHRLGDLGQPAVDQGQRLVEGRATEVVAVREPGRDHEVVQGPPEQGRVLEPARDPDALLGQLLAVPALVAVVELDRQRAEELGALRVGHRGAAGGDVVPRECFLQRLHGLLVDLAEVAPVPHRHPAEHGERAAEQDVVVEGASHRERLCERRTGGDDVAGETELGGELEEHLEPQVAVGGAGQQHLQGTLPVQRGTVVRVPRGCGVGGRHARFVGRERRRPGRRVEEVVRKLVEMGAEVLGVDRRDRRRQPLVSLDPGRGRDRVDDRLAGQVVHEREGAGGLVAAHQPLGPQRLERPDHVGHGGAAGPGDHQRVDPPARDGQELECLPDTGCHRGQPPVHDLGDGGRDPARAAVAQDLRQQEGVPATAAPQRVGRFGVGLEAAGPPADELLDLAARERLEPEPGDVLPGSHVGDGGARAW